MFFVGEGIRRKGNSMRGGVLWSVKTGPQKLVRENWSFILPKDDEGYDNDDDWQ